MALCTNCNSSVEQGTLFCEKCVKKMDVFFAKEGKMLDEQRGVGKFIIFSILTFGIYSLYSQYTLARDVNIICEGDGKKTAGLFKSILLTIVTFGIYGVVWQGLLADRLKDNAPRYGLAFKEDGLTIVLWDVLGAFIIVGPFIAMHKILKNVNDLAREYNKAMHNKILKNVNALAREYNKTPLQELLPDEYNKTPPQELPGEYKKCPSCGVDIKTDAIVCKHCWASL